MDSAPQTSAPVGQLDAQPAGGDDHKSARRGAIFIGLALAAFVVYLFVTGQVAEFVDAMKNVSVPWLLVACFFMLLYLIFGILAYAIAVWLDPDSPVGIRDLISVEASGIFFGNLTPMMMGSTPAQIYRLTKAGQNVGEAGATQFTRFIVYQAGLVIWGGILLAARMPFFIERYSDIQALTLLCFFSFGGHVLILISIFAIALMPKTVTRVAYWGLSVLARVGVSTDKIDRWRAFVDEEIFSFSEKFKLSAGHTSSMALTVVITMFQLAFFYLVPYFIMLAFGRHDVDFLSVMAASAFVQLLSSAVPLPGGTGGAEGGFALFLGHFFGGAATAGYLLWRLITFIAPTILAAPLLGLRSAHNASIHARWDAVLARLGISRAKREGDVSHRRVDAARCRTTVEGARGGVRVAPSAEVRLAATEASASESSSVSAAPAPASPAPRPRPQTVRRSAAGITVVPSAYARCAHKPCSDDSGERP